MILLIPLLPFLAGLAALAIPSRPPRRLLLLMTSVVHVTLVALAGFRLSSLRSSAWLGIDGVSLLFLGITSLLFLAAALSAVETMCREEQTAAGGSEPAVAGAGRSERIFVACLLFFLSSMSLVTVSRHLGLLWVAVEATTLASAPLIYYHRSKRSLEAAWKYLLICSVGIALALLGNFFLAVATSVGTGHQIPLGLDQLLAQAVHLDPSWLKAAFLILLVGYGTKMGLVPMHSWLPDAHSEAPSAVSALLSGALLNCAFLGILRIQEVMVRAGLGGFGREQLVVFGILSMSVAAIFLLTQTDFKRMLAYSSIEHMGVMALGAGLGGAASLGALLHALNHSLTKGALFLAAGSILAFSGTKDSQAIKGLSNTAPVTAAVWLTGVIAVVGMPPFGMFTSELIILKEAVGAGRWLVVTGFLAALSLAFMAMVPVALRMVLGDAEAGSTPHTTGLPAPGLAGGVIPAILLLAVLVIGLYIPGPLQHLLDTAVLVMGAP